VGSLRQRTPKLVDLIRKLIHHAYGHSPAPFPWHMPNVGVTEPCVEGLVKIYETGAHRIRST
jgi:hypothetical protein